ncbi:hypothetical protein AB0N09_30800 [Streptomyces erythrochromogenes]|uniref:hypothetical protein n=1 Tax=Streptomyces erythrochromogenes TaxID=285574 RepID=UPI0034152FB1
MAFFGLFGNDQQMATTTYSGRESATERAAQRRRVRHRSQVSRVARKGQKWEDEDRAREGRRR